MEFSELRRFLLAANAAGYASGVTEKKEADGSNTITFSQGDFSMHDNFFGGEPYGGREVVFYKGRAVWMMVYYGWVDPKFNDLKSVYNFLREALKLMPKELPFRGPEKFKQGQMEYLNVVGESDIDDFYGSEKILLKGKKIYQADYAGGLVDQRSG